MRQEKQLLLDEVTEIAKRFDSFFVMRYRGLTANLANSFCLQVHKRGGDVHVLRKRLLLKAMEHLDISLDSVEMDGHLGLVFSQGDPVEMTKALIQFGKENNDAVEIIGAHVEKSVLGPKEISILAELPSKDVMRAQLLATLEAPLSQTLAVVEALLCSVPHCLENKAKEEGDAA